MSDFIEITNNLAPSFPESFFSTLNIPSNKSHDSFSIFTLHKCASTMLQRCFEKIGDFNGITNVALDKWIFSTGYTYTSENKKEFKNLFVPKGYWYGVYRGPFIKWTDWEISKKKSILLVRDPRDIVVSHYFSMSYSHVAPGSKNVKMCDTPSFVFKEINEYVVEVADKFNDVLERYIDDLLPLGNTKLFRYEDVILDKIQFFVPAMNHLNLDFPRKDFLKMIVEETQIPSTENVHQHIRRVLPGDYKNKLSEETIDKLNNKFRRVLDYFDYN